MCVCLVADLGRDCMGSVRWDGEMKLGTGRAECVCMFVLVFRGWVGSPFCEWRGVAGHRMCVYVCFGFREFKLIVAINNDWYSYVERGEMNYVITII